MFLGAHHTVEPTEEDAVRSIVAAAQRAKESIAADDAAEPQASMARRPARN